MKCHVIIINIVFRSNEIVKAGKGRRYDLLGLSILAMIPLGTDDGLII